MKQYIPKALLAALLLFFAGCQKSPAEKLAADKEAKSDAISKQLMGQ